MKKKYIIGSIAVLALSICAYELGRYQSVSSKADNRVAYVDSKSKEKGKKAENLTPDEISAKDYRPRLCNFSRGSLSLLQWESSLQCHYQ